MAEKKIAVGMSGGVDSSVAAALLVEQGYDVIGVTMQIWNEEYTPSSDSADTHACFGPGEAADIEDARIVAEQLGIPFHVVDLRAEYEEIVLDYFRNEYNQGRTPNPCLRCNRRLKFGALLEALAAAGLKWDYYATGHYVRRLEENGRHLLLRGVDSDKDQSYFLYSLSQEQLARTLFPLGELNKNEVRARATELGLTVEEKAESQDFYAGDYTELLEGTGRSGPIVDTDGEKIGEHEGIENYTFGQRRGLGLAVGHPIYVIDIDAAENKLIVGRREELFDARMKVEKLNWILPPSEVAPESLEVQIRYQHSPARAELTAFEEGERVEVEFEQPQRAVTPGQAAVFYSGDRVLGGGIITE